MLRFSFLILLLLILFNSFSFINEPPEIYRIIGHMMFMPILGTVYGILRKWLFGQIDKMVFSACIIGSFGDGILFFDLAEKGEFLQLVSAFFVHLIFIVIFRREGAFVFNIAKTNILKVIIPAMLVFFFFGFVLLKVLPVLLYFTAILYAVEVTILAVLGYFRPVKNLNYWFVAIGVSVVILKDFLYSYFFYIYKGSQPLLYVPFYWGNAIGYFLIIYGVAMNQNSTNINYEIISKKALINSIKNIFHVQKKTKIKPHIYETLFFSKYFGQNLDEA